MQKARQEKRHSLRPQRENLAQGLLAIAIGGLMATTCAADPSDLCITAARQAAADSAVPLSVLLAITQLETGRERQGRVEPWPWAVNLEGEGIWHDSRDAALRYAKEALATGRTSFDTGCFQINYRWHSNEFPSLEAMFDPLENARYAARFLSELYAETGDWTLAAGAYHSRTEAHAARYRESFEVLRLAASRSGVDDGLLMAKTELNEGSGRPPLLAPRVNFYPLLQSSEGKQALGSLVPVSGGG